MNQFVDSELKKSANTVLSSTDKNKVIEVNKNKFEKLKLSILKPIVDDLNEAFKPKNDEFFMFSNTDSKAQLDRIRTFSQIFYFQKKDRRMGLNSPSILFECNPEKGTIDIRQHIEHYPSSLVKIDTRKIEDITEEIIIKHITAFVKKVSKETYV